MARRSPSALRSDGIIGSHRYIYYHCTGYKGRCDEPYIREEILERQFSDLLGLLSFDNEALEWVRDALHASHADERREHEGAIKRLQTEHRRLQNRLDVMYVDKVDGRVDAAFYERMSRSWREEQARCLREIEQHQAANRSYMDEGVRLLELARNARNLFERQEAREKRRLLDFLVSNCSWKNGELTVTLRQPFDLLAETTLALEKVRAVDGIADDPSQFWLPGPDSNQRPSG